MPKLDFYLGNPLVFIPPPENWEALQIELAFENGSPEGVLNATILVWKGPNAALMNQWLNTGLSGGVGIYEGIPLQIKICDTDEVVFNGIVDLTDPDVRFNCDIVKCRIRDKRMDMVTQLFDSISFAYLATPKTHGGAEIIIPKVIADGGDYFPVPYQRNNIPDAIEAMITILSIYETIEMLEKVRHEVLAAINAAIGASASLSLGATIVAIVELLALIAELVVMILVLVKLVISLMDELIGHVPAFKKLGMKALTLAQKACQYFGLQFSSSILTGAYTDLIVLPAKQAWDSNLPLSNIVTSFFTVLGAPSRKRMNYDDEFNLKHGGMAYGYYDGTIGDFFRTLEDVFDAKMKIIFTKQGVPVLHFERWNYQYLLSQFQLPNISDQAPFPQSFGTNASELPANYLISYATDDSDLNTINSYNGTSCYAQTQPLVVSVQKNVVLKNLVEKTFQYSQGLIKTRLSITEHIFNALWDLVTLIPRIFIGALNGIIKIVNKVLKFLGAGSIPTIPQIPTNPFNARLGQLLLSNDVTNQPKLLLCEANGKLYQSNHTPTDPLAARNLFKNFHYSSLAQTKDPSGNSYSNEYLTYQDQEIPLCCTDYNTVRNNNYIRTFDGQIAKVTSLKWNIFKGIARIDYRVNKTFTKNLKTSFVIDGAETTSTL